MNNNRCIKKRRLGKSAWSKIWKYVVYLRPALRIDCREDHLWRTVDRSLPRLTGAFLRAWLRLHHGAFWGCAPAPLTKLDLIDWLIDCISEGCWSMRCRGHDDVIKWKNVLHYWPFVRGIHRSRWIPRAKASDAELWCFLWSAPE